MDTQTETQSADGGEAVSRSGGLAGPRAEALIQDWLRLARDYREAAIHETGQGNFAEAQFNEAANSMLRHCVGQLREALYWAS